MTPKIIAIVRIAVENFSRFGHSRLAIGCTFIVSLVSPQKVLLLTKLATKAKALRDLGA
jgi:hypothetical protein